MTTRWFLTPLIAFAVGVGVGSIFSIPATVAVWCALIGLVLGVLWRRRSARFILLLSLVFVGLAIGFFRIEIASWEFGQSELAAAVGSDIDIVGVVKKEPDVRERSVQLFVETRGDRILVSADRLSDVSYGDTVAVSGRLDVPESFETDLGRTFDYPGYLKAKGVEYRISFATIEVQGSGGGNVVVRALLRLKHAFMQVLEQALPEPQVGLGEGLLLGVKQALGDDLETAFRRTGIIHIVVLSGYNVMLVASFMLFCLSYVLPLRARVVGGIITIMGFALLVGLSATVVRASVMACVLLIAHALGRQYDVLRALFFAGAMMLLINPYLLVYDIGFQLSFMATLGLILAIPHFESTVVRSGLVSLKSFFFATVATQIAVLPLLLHHIGEVSLVAVIVNVLVLPVVPIAMLLTFLVGLVGFVSLSAAQFLGVFAVAVLTYIIVIAEWFGALSFAALSVPEFGAEFMILVYASMFGAFLMWRSRSAGNSTSDWEIEEEMETAGEGSTEPSPAVSSPALPKIFR